MEGSVIVDFGRGWACSNVASQVTERDLITNPDGSRYSKHIETLRLFSALNVKGEIAVGDVGDAVFMQNGTKEKTAYGIEVSAITEDYLILSIKQEKEDYKDIVKKIGGYNYGQ